MTCSITLNGRADSDLQWEAERRQALEAKERGESLFWHLDLGWSDGQGASFEKTLRLAFEHFLDTLYEEFSEETLGLSFYEGALQEVTPEMLEEFDRMTDLVPDELSLYLLLDCSSVDHPWTLARKLDAGSYFRFKRALKNASLHYGDAVWGEGVELKEPEEVGLLFPALETEKATAAAKELVELFSKASFSFRLIAEEQLLNDWEGMQAIVVHPAFYTRDLYRKLLGFAAAEGLVYVYGQEGIGVPDERTFDTLDEILTLSS